jgi:hypothetical protein
VERFWGKIQVLSPDECWDWLYSTNKDGYGNFWFQGSNVNSHRVAWILTFGPIPNGLDILHKCDNPPCCNPSHLFLGTHEDNMRDMGEKGRANTLIALTARRSQARNPELLGEILRLKGMGLSCRLIGDKVGLSNPTVSRILRELR